WVARWRSRRLTARQDFASATAIDSRPRSRYSPLESTSRLCTPLSTRTSWRKSGLSHRATLVRLRCKRRGEEHEPKGRYHQTHLVCASPCVVQSLSRNAEAD